MQHPCFTTYYEGLSRTLINDVKVLPAFDKAGNPISKYSGAKTWHAQWDTGATNTCISKKIAQELDLDVVSQKKMFTPSGEKISDCYAVHIILPQGVRIDNLCVLEGELRDIDILIGMDIIGRGDLIVSNHDNQTVFTFRMPSLMTFDFIKKSYLSPHIAEAEPGRNDMCPCRSGKKYKNCCGANTAG